MPRQKGPRWGAVVVDDASEPRIAEHFEMACEALGERATIIRNRQRQGSLANLVTAVRLVCTNPESVIVTLDADDTLLGDGVLERLAAKYESGADLTVGSMLRTDKAAKYPAELEAPRTHRGGNVWQHLRSFRKRLFDAIPDEALRLDGEYIELASDWAFMLPMVETATRPVQISQPALICTNRLGAERERIERCVKRRSDESSRERAESTSRHRVSRLRTRRWRPDHVHRTQRQHDGRNEGTVPETHAPARRGKGQRLHRCRGGI